MRYIFVEQNPKHRPSKYHIPHYNTSAFWLLSWSPQSASTLFQRAFSNHENLSQLLKDIITDFDCLSCLIATHSFWLSHTLQFTQTDLKLQFQPGFNEAFWIPFSFTFWKQVYSFLEFHTIWFMSHIRLLGLMVPSEVSKKLFIDHDFFNEIS